VGRHGKDTNYKEKPVLKAAVVHEFGHPLRIEDVPVPRPGIGEFVI
jgi:hypothetical protein